MIITTISIGIAIILCIVVLVLWQRLRSLAAVAKRQQSQTEALLNGCEPGLFVLDRHYRIVAPYSAALTRLLGRSDLAGAGLFELLQDKVSGEVLDTARDYIDVLFLPHIREELVHALNPLTELVFYVGDRRGRKQLRYIDFHFRRLPATAFGSLHLLVSVSDVSRRIALGRALESAETRAQKQMSMLVKLLHVEAPMLQEFLERAGQGLQDISTILRSHAGQRDRYHQALGSILPIVQLIKGDASLLRLDLFELKAHQFEDDIARLRKCPTLSDDDLLMLALDLDQFINDLNSVKAIATHLEIFNTMLTGPRASEDPLALPDLELLIHKIADSQGKQVRLTVQGRETASTLPDPVALALRDILIQLTRNAVTHGIETPLQRVRQGKAETGEILLAFRINAGGDYELILRDDGAGIDAADIRGAALKSGRWSERELADRDDRSILQLLFEPGFSTREEVSVSAGRGVGLAIIHEHLQQLHSQLQIATRPGEYCEWRITIPASSVRTAGIRETVQ